MSRIKDRTEDFKDAVGVAALSYGYTESQLAATMASFIMHRPTHKSAFLQAAIKTLESIKQLEIFIVKHREDYVDLHRSTEQERDTIEHEVDVFVKTCKDQIDILKNRIHDDENTRTWLHMRDDSSDAYMLAHKHGVVLVLSERLHTVTVPFDYLRSLRFQDAVNRRMPRRKVQRLPENKSSKNPNSDFHKLEDQELSAGPIRIQDQLLDNGTQALQVKLTNLFDRVQDLETKMVEMSARYHLLSTHVLQQAQQIEFWKQVLQQVQLILHFYNQVFVAINNVLRENMELFHASTRNIELSQASTRNSSSSTFHLFFIFVLTFTNLLLVWYS